MHRVRKIYMIDDDTEDREIFREALGSIDPSIVCLQPASAGLAIDLLLKETEQPNYIFVDINMPVMGGFEFIEEIKALRQLSNIPVIVYTTSNESEHKEKAKKLGAASYITKPASFSILRAKLEEALMVDYQSLDTGIR